MFMLLKNSLYSFCFSGICFLNICAAILPEKLCHTENIAPGTAAIGNIAKWVAASDVASPEFCMPTSMAMAERLRLSLPVSAARLYPNIRPNTLCIITAMPTIRLQLVILSELCATIIPIIEEIAKVENIGNKGVISLVTFLK